MLVFTLKSSTLEVKQSKITRSTKKWPQIKKRKIFFADQNRLKNICLRGFFFIWAHYTPLWPILWIFICLSFFFIISVGGQNFSEAIFTQKMTRKKKKIFFSPTKLGWRTIVSVVFFLSVPIIPPFDHYCGFSFVLVFFSSYRYMVKIFPRQF